MFGDILQYGSVFDWISPMLSVVEDLANGESHTFLIPQDCGWTGREIANLLRRNGIKTWGHMIVNDTIMISVRQPQAAYANYLLQRSGLPSGADPVIQVRERSGQTKVRHPDRDFQSLGDLLRDIGNIRL